MQSASGDTAVLADHVGAEMRGLGAADTPPGITLEQMRQRWEPRWLVWRSRNQDGEPNEWCATRRGHGRELSMTLMEPTAGDSKRPWCGSRMGR